MTTVAEIAKRAFDGVSASITDAAQSITATDGTVTLTGRAVFTSTKAPNGFPLSTAKDRVEEAVLEGLSAVPSAGWEINSQGVTYFVLSIRDIVKAGGAIMARVIAESDMLWKPVTIERRQRTPDGAGGYTEAWTQIASAQGGLVAVSGQERWASSRTEATAKWVLVVKHIDGLLASDRAMADGRAYDIEFVNDHEERGIWDVLHLGEGMAP